MTKSVELDNIVTDNENFMTWILGLFAGLDCRDMLWWQTEHDYGPFIRFYVMCNDTFTWATADMEEVTSENAQDLEQAIADVQAIDPDADEWMGPLLFCARQRGLRPMPRMTLPENLKPLFDACGPERTSNDSPE